MAACGRYTSFIDRADHALAVRLYAGKFSVEKAVTLAGREYQLVNLPYYLASRVERYLDGNVA